MREFSSSSHLTAIHLNDDDGVSPWWKTLLVLALMVPMTAYVAGSLASSDVALPTDREPVIIEDSTSRTPERSRPNKDTAVKDAEQGDGGRTPATSPSSQTSSTPAPAPTPRSTPVPNTSPSRTSAPELVVDDDDEPRDDHSPQVVTPKPTPIDDDDEQTGGDRDEDTDGDDDAGGGGDDDAGDSSSG